MLPPRYLLTECAHHDTALAETKKPLRLDISGTN